LKSLYSAWPLDRKSGGRSGGTHCSSWDEQCHAAWETEVAQKLPSLKKLLILIINNFCKFKEASLNFYRLHENGK
jgi:hypothetical protein